MHPWLVVDVLIQQWAKGLPQHVLVASDHVGMRYISSCMDGLHTHKDFTRPQCCFKYSIACQGREQDCTGTATHQGTMLRHTLLV